MGKSSVKQLVTLQKKPINYQTKVVGGMVMKTPVAEGFSESLEQSGARNGEDKGAQAPSSRKSRGYPRVMKAGHGIKLGAVVRCVLVDVELAFQF